VQVIHTHGTLPLDR